MDAAGDRDFHVKGRHGCGTTSPALHREWVVSYLWPKALQGFHYFLGPVGGELIMSIDVDRWVVIISRLAMLVVGVHIEQLAINVTRIVRAYAGAVRTSLHDWMAAAERLIWQ